MTRSDDYHAPRVIPHDGRWLVVRRIVGTRTDAVLADCWTQRGAELELARIINRQNTQESNHV
jgi:hypothetical protein